MNKKSFEKQAFSRNRLLFGEESNTMVQNTHAFIFGIGGVGAIICEQLVRLGVKKITFFARNHYETGNINRQIPATFITTSVRIPKIYALAQHLKEINPFCEINPIYCDVIKDSKKILDTLKNDKPKILFNCVDEYKAQIHISNIAYQFKLPMIIGGVTGIGDKGIVTTFFDKGNLYNKLFDIYEIDNEIDKRIKDIWLKNNSKNLSPEIVREYKKETKKPYPVITPLPWMIASGMIVEFIKIVLNQNFIIAPNYIDYNPKKYSISINNFNKTNRKDYIPWRP